MTEIHVQGSQSHRLRSLFLDVWTCALLNVYSIIERLSTVCLFALAICKCCSSFDLAQWLAVCR